MAPNDPQGMHSLSTIIKRLEAVTSRLEDVAVSSVPNTGSSLRSATGQSHDAVSSHLHSNSAPQAPPAPPAPSAPATEEASSPAAKAYEDEIINDALATFLGKSKDIGGLVEQHAQLFPTLCTAQLSFLKLAGNHSKPSAKDFGTLLKPQADAIQAIMEAKDKLSRSKEGRDWAGCLSTMGEGAPAWGWVQVEPAPAPYVNEMKGAAQFWADRVTKQFKEQKPEMVEWNKSYIALIDKLHAYVKQWHTTGVAWNAKGSPAPSAISSAPTAPPAPTGPPAPPAPPSVGAAPAAAASAGGAAALLADLNRGGSVTSGLKKVDPSQMTHKNPELRAAGIVPDKKAAPPVVKAKPGALSQGATKKPPKMELEDGNKWMIENQDGNKDISIDQTELQHTLHIFGCTNSVIRIAGKINAITMVGCKKTALVLDSAVSSLSITSSPSFEIQITGSLPTILIDNTDSGQIYLSKECMNIVEIITSKTSALNISLPTGSDGDFEEKAVPEQMKSRVVGGKLITEIVEHAG